MNDAPSLFLADRLDLMVEPKVWDFANQRRAEIDAFFAQLQAKQPALWNGRVLLMHRYAFEANVLHGAFMDVDYASFSAWRRWGKPAAACDCFGAAAVQVADGAFLLGVMGEHTFNAGQTYFPCGTPDRNDIVGGKVDFDASVRRELKEETGIDAGELAAEPGWTIVVDGQLIAAIKVLRSGLAAEPLRARMLTHLARETRSELSDIRIVRGPGDFDATMPDFVTRFLFHRFTSGQAP